MAAKKKANQNSIQLPDNYDPYDMDLKRQLNPHADEKNYIEIRQGKPKLVCGAKKRRREGLCRSFAGLGTKHVGYGRCKYCGGCNTGPKTEAGKQQSSANSLKHGLYSKGLMPNEVPVYQEILREDLLDLKEEIAFLKTKIISYIDRWRLKQIGAGYNGTIQWYKEGNEKSFYHAGTIEDKPLMRAFQDLGRLVEKQARITGENKDDLIGQINAELRAASQVKAKDSWGTPAQSREEKV